MNTRICSVIAVAMLMTCSSGCSGMRDFLYGRGARCGLCNKSAPPAGVPGQAPCGPVPYATAPPAPCQGPAQGGAVAAPGCGCNGYAAPGQVGAGVPQAYNSAPCGTCGEYAAASGGCGCGGVVDNYAPVVTDPYMSGEVVGGAPYGAPVVSDQVIGGTVQPYPGTIAPVQPDDFSARKFDSDGNRILWEQPIPNNATAL